jgi:hypothetical protein
MKDRARQVRTLCVYAALAVIGLGIGSVIYALKAPGSFEFPWGWP